MSYSLKGNQVIQDHEDSDDAPPGLASDAGSSDSDSPRPSKRRGAAAASRPVAASRRPTPAPLAAAASPRPTAASSRRPQQPAAPPDDEPPGFESSGADDDDSDDGDDYSDVSAPLPNLEDESDSEQVDSEVELGKQAGDGQESADEEDALPGMVSGDSSDSEGEGQGGFYGKPNEPPAAAQQKPQQAQHAQRTAATAQKPKPVKKAKAPKAAKQAGSESEGEVPELVSDAGGSDEDSEEEGLASDSDGEWGGPQAAAAGGRGQQQQQRKKAAATAGRAGKKPSLNTGFFEDGKQRKAAPVGSAGGAARPGSAGSGQPPPAAQFAEAQAQQAQRGRRPKQAGPKEKVEKVEAQVAEDEGLMAALKMEEEERKALRKKMGLDDDDEEEQEDPVLGECAYGSQCSRDPEDHRVKTSHADRYEFRCSAGHRLFYHQPCWRKATVRLVDAKGEEQLVVGKDYKWPKKSERKKCVDPTCDGVVTFVEGPNKYSILADISEEVRKEQGGGEEAVEEVPEWERYQREKKKEKRFGFKKGKGKRATEEEEEEAFAPQTVGKAARSQQQQAEEQAAAGEAEDASSAQPLAAAAAAAEETEELSASTPALPDDRLLQALKRNSSDEDLLGMTRRPKDKGKAAMRDAEIVYEDKPDRKKKSKGIKLVLGGGFSKAEQRRQQQQQQAQAAEDEQDRGTRRRQQGLGVNEMDFPDLEEAQLLGKEKRWDELDRAARDRSMAAQLTALRSFQSDDVGNCSALLVENIDFRRIAEDEGIRPEMCLRSTFADYGHVKEVHMHQPCKAALVSYSTSAQAYKGYMLLNNKVLWGSKLTVRMLKRLPKDEEVSSKVQQLLAEAERREAEGDEWAHDLTEEEHSVHSMPPSMPSSTGPRAPLYSTDPAYGAASSSSGGTLRSPISQSIGIPGAAAVPAVPAMPAGPSSSSLGGSFGGTWPAAGTSAGGASNGSFASTPGGGPGGLRVNAAEFRPGGAPGPAAGDAEAAGAGPAGAQAGDELTSMYLSAQLIPADAASYQVFLDYGDAEFGLPPACLASPGETISSSIAFHTYNIASLSPDAASIALLMYDAELACLYGVWSARKRQYVAEQGGEVVVFQRQRILPPLPRDAVEAMLKMEGMDVKLPQKLPAVNVRNIMRAFLAHERAQAAQQAAADEASQQAAAAAAAAEAARRAAAAALHAPPPSAPPPPPRPPPQQQQDQWFAAQQRLLREQEMRDAELARALQEQLVAEAQLEEQQRMVEDRSMAAALRDSGPRGGSGSTEAASTGKWAAAAAARPPPPPRASAPGAAGPAMGGIFSSLFPGQRQQGAAGQAPAGATALGANGARSPSPGHAGRAPYRPPSVGGYRPPSMGAPPPSAAPAAAAGAVPYRPPVGAPPAAAPTAALAPAVPAVAATAAAAPQASAAALAAAPSTSTGAAAAAAAGGPAGAGPPPPLKDPCVQCRQRESVHIWIPCGHRGHCPECLSDSVPLDQKLTQFPKCLVCGALAQYYIRMFT